MIWPSVQTLYGTQFGSVPSTTERQTGLPSAPLTTSSARWLRVMEKSLRYVSEKITVLYVALTS